MAPALVEPTLAGPLPRPLPRPLPKLLPKPQPDQQAARRTLLAQFRGQTILVPNLVPLFQHWPVKISPELEHIRDNVGKYIDRVYPPGPAVDALQAADFGHFGAIWWPHAPFSKLRIVTYLIVWLFVWDDEIDNCDGTMWDEFGAAQNYQEQTLSYVKYTVGIDDICPSGITNPIILNFKPIGEAVKERYDLGRRMIVYNGMKLYMEMSEKEQRLRLDGHIPTIQEF